MLAHGFSERNSNATEIEKEINRKPYVFYSSIVEAQNHHDISRTQTFIQIADECNIVRVSKRKNYAYQHYTAIEENDEEEGKIKCVLCEWIRMYWLQRQSQRKKQ